MKKNILLKSNIVNILFYFTYSLICFNFMSSSVLFMKNYHNILTLISLIILLFIFIIQSHFYEKKSLMYIFISLIIGVLSYVFSGDNAFILIILLIVCTKNLSLKKIVVFDLIIKIVFVFIILLLYKNGGTEYITRYRIDGTRRLAMGFGHPNVFAAYLFFICLSICYLRYKKMNIFLYFIIFICLFIIHFVCDSRSAEISLLLLLIFSVFSNFFEKLLFKRKIFSLLPLFAFCISLIFTKLFLEGNSFALYIDNLLNKRLFYSAIVFSNVGFPLFGVEITEYVKFGLDNAYLNVFYQYGFFSTFLLFYCIYKVIIFSQKNKNNDLLMCMLVFLIYGFMEKFSFHIEYNVFLFAISSLLYFKCNYNCEGCDINE